MKRKEQGPGIIGTVISEAEKWSTYGSPILLPKHRQRIKFLLEMDGITPEEQQELFDLGLHRNEQNLILGQKLTEEYLARGATFRNKRKNDEKPKR